MVKKRFDLPSSDELIAFETEMKECYENKEVKGTVHLSGNNESELLHIFQYISPDDWVFSTWRNHYHALLHGVPKDKLKEWILEGRSMGINHPYPRFYASSIVGGIIPIALGAAFAVKQKKEDRRVWCFIGDMAMETGGFWEAYKYVKNFDLPLEFVIEDNKQSVITKTEDAWGTRMEVPKGLWYYSYEMIYPHHGTGKWVNF